MCSRKCMGKYSNITLGAIMEQDSDEAQIDFIAGM